MDGEKEKKDKLAAARKKLNEYKLNRSGGGKSGPAVDSSKPADVPLFYQNINTSSPPVFNIFNPAALDNNNVSPNTNQFYSAAPPTNQETEKVEVSANLWEQPPHQLSPQTDHQQLQGNYGGSFPSAQPEEVLLTTTDVETGATSSAMLFQPVEQSEQSNMPILADGNIIEHDSSKETGNSLRAADSFLQNYETVERTDEYKPSAPYENKADVKMEDTSASSVATDLSYPPVIPPKNEPLDISTGHVESMIMFRDSEDPSASTNVFASSLFSSTGGNELDNVFNIQGSTQFTPNLHDNSMSSQNETSGSLSIDEISQVNPLIRPVQNLITPEMEECIDLVNSQAVKETERGEKELDTRGFVSGQGFSHDEYPVSPTIQSGELPDMQIDVQKSSDQTMSPTQDNQEILLHTATGTSLPIRNEESYQLQENLLEDSQTKDISGNSEAFQRMKSVQEALDLQIEELRRENSHLLSRQTELTLKFEESEKLAHEFKLERDRVKEEATTTSQALRSRINSLCEENQRILKNSTEVGVDQRAKLEDKTRQLEEMQKAVIIVSQSKMDFAGRLDHELERVKELQNVVKEKDEEIQVLRTANSDLEEKLKLEQQKDAVIHQLENQARHYKVQCETLLKELNYLRKRVATPEIHGEANSAKHTSDPSHNHAEPHEDHDHATHDHGHCDQLHANTANNHMGEIARTHHPEIHQHHDQERVNEVGSAEHVHETGSSNQNSHSSDHWEHEGHSHHEHHSHDHGHGHHSHEHDHHHEEPLDRDPEVVARLGPSDEVSELKKTLHRLQWENSTFRNELDVLAVDAKQKKSYEEKCAALEAENEYLKDEVEKLEHVVIQLQGENDTIGDYVTLYQTQKMALKEVSKEKDAQLELLAKEREILLSRLADLTNLVKDLRESKSESSSQCADDHIHSFEVPGTGGTNKRQLEGKIHDLLTEISSSSLIENFHPCAVCSGRLMTV